MPIKVDPGDKKVLYSKVAEVRSILQNGGGEVGISFQNDKGMLLLPKDWEPPDPMVVPGLVLRSNTFADPSLQGMEIVGAPVGSVDFCSSSKCCHQSAADAPSLCLGGRLARYKLEPHKIFEQFHGTLRM